ncbi:MAG: MarR family transcriptional regulator [Clostridia bacterium]|nr:MarR family transcriptional regulator [Clostridia bacterium]
MEKAIINKIIEINECCLPISKLILNNNTLGAYSTSELFLMDVYSRKNITASGFAKNYGLSQSYVGKIARRLEKDGMLVRTQYEEDTRFILLSITEKGKTFIESTIKTKNSELCEKLSLLSDREQSELITAFCKITDILK